VGQVYSGRGEMRIITDGDGTKVVPCSCLFYESQSAGMKKLLRDNTGRLFNLVITDVGQTANEGMISYQHP